MTAPASALLALLILASCAPSPAMQGSPPAQAESGDARLTGTVATVGSVPISTQVVLRGEDGRSTQIRGPLLDEIRRLSGARVELHGRLSDGALEATGYRIRSVNGAPVEMGIVERNPAGGVQLRKENGEVVQLVGATSQFQIGQKVWVQGPTTQAVRVQSFGVLSR